MTYTVDGKQQVSLLVGWGGAGQISGTLAAQHGWKYRVHPRRLVTFVLDGKTPLPPSPPPAFAKPVDVPDLTLDADKVAYGQHVYSQSCFLCHGGGVVSGGAAPDLRESPVVLNKDAFKQVLVDGVRLPLGMPRFKDFTDKELDGLSHYIRSQARKALAGNATAAK